MLTAASSCRQSQWGTAAVDCRLIPSMKTWSVGVARGAPVTSRVQLFQFFLNSSSYFQHRDQESSLLSSVAMWPLFTTLGKHPYSMGKYASRAQLFQFFLNRLSNFQHSGWESALFSSVAMWPPFTTFLLGKNKKICNQAPTFSFLFWIAFPIFVMLTFL